MTGRATNAPGVRRRAIAQIGVEASTSRVPRNRPGPAGLPAPMVLRLNQEFVKAQRPRLDLDKVELEAAKDENDLADDFWTLRAFEGA